MRLHLFEFEDLPWFPKFIRDGGTDFLGFILNKAKFYEPTIEVIEQVIQETKHNRILDLCSGNGGPIASLSQKLAPESDITFVLSDKFPNLPAFDRLKQTSNNKIDYLPEPLDVITMDGDAEGIRTMYSAIHHFKPREVRIILGNVVQSGMPLCIFDSGDKHIGTILGIMIFHPLLFIFCTPFIRPFTLSRILFTYLIPIIPLYTIWDGIVSIIRLHRPDKLLSVAKSVDKSESYVWKSGKLKNKIGFSIAYLTGIPKN